MTKSQFKDIMYKLFLKCYSSIINKINTHFPLATINNFSYFNCLLIEEVILLWCNNPIDNKRGIPIAKTNTGSWIESPYS